MTSIDVPLPKICNEIQNAQFVVPNKLKQMWCFTQPIMQFKLMFSQCFMKINYYLILDFTKKSTFFTLFNPDSINLKYSSLNSYLYYI
jgi:hypothetical protein